MRSIRRSWNDAASDVSAALPFIVFKVSAMLHFLISQIHNYSATPLRLIDYVTFRAGCALMTAVLIAILLGPWTIRRLKNATAPARLEGLVDEKFQNRQKDKTPSMGGLLIVFSILTATLLWGNLQNRLLLLFIGTLLAFAAIGFWDDSQKIFRKKRDGISAKTKFLSQCLVAGTASALLYFTPEVGNHFQELYLPFMKTPVWTMPLWLALIFSILVIVGASNAVNLTDGKDGLAVGCTIFCVLTYGAFAYMSSHMIFAKHLGLHFLGGGGAEIVVLSAAIAGACIGFLWHNCHPAAMFMGDTGSLALGGTIGFIAVLVSQELLLIVVGGVFVMEIASVMLQVASFKLTGKRIFRCTPIHHHFEQIGWTETQIVTRFWILAGLFALIGLATLKLR